MNRKWSWVGVPLVAVLAVAASVLLRDRSAPLLEDEGTPAQRIEDVLTAPDTPALPAAPPSGSAFEDVSDFARLQRLQALRELAAAATIAAAGDLTTSSLTGDGLGYLDVDAIINNNDPSSIVAFLLAHSDETGADESLEIEIDDIVDYPNNKVVIFDQLIDGKHSIEGRGSIDFDPATGAVISARVSLVTPDPALAGSVVILQDEAVAIARAAVAAAVLQEEGVAITRDGDALFVQPRLRPGFAFQISRVTVKELRSALDPKTNKARFEWPIWISARGVDGGLSWEVLVDASTGEIAGIKDLERRNAGVCSDLTYRFCDGSLMTDKEDGCGPGILNKAKPLSATDPEAARVIRHAKAMTAKIKGVDSSYIGAVRGLNCEVEIVVNVPDALMGNAAGIYQPHNDRILLPRGAGRSTIAHEIMHALTKTGDYGVEHGLVDSAEALFMCGGNDKWTYGNEDFTGTPPFVSSGTHHSVTHAIYRIHGATDKDTAFKIVLGTDREAPTATSAHGVIFGVAKRVGEEAAVTRIYKDLGIWPSQADIDDIVDSVIREMERRVGPLLIPPRAEMEDKVEEIVNEELSNGQFNQGMIIVRAGEKADEYRLEKVKELEEAKEKYKKLLKEAMAQLTEAQQFPVGEVEKERLRRRVEEIAAAARGVYIDDEDPIFEWIEDLLGEYFKTESGLPVD